MFALLVAVSLSVFRAPLVCMFALLLAVSLSVFRASLGCTSTGISDGDSVSTLVLRASIIVSLMVSVLRFVSSIGVEWDGTMLAILVLSDLGSSASGFTDVAVSSGEEEVVDCSFCFVTADKEGVNNNCKYKL